MIIKSVQVKNFRSIKDETLHCDKLTALVGANGSGKSSFLHALELFYNKSPKIEEEDYYNKDASEEIIISITFSELSDEAKKLFANYIQGNDLTVERVFKYVGGKHISKFHGSTLQNPDFKETKEAFDVNALTAKQKYNELKVKSEYSTFPTWSNAGTAKETIKTWEMGNASKCIRQRDDGQFFGFNEVGQGYLGKFSRVLYIPAVRDASTDASEVRGSPLNELMDLVIRSSLAQKEEIKTFQSETREKYGKIMDPSKLTELDTLAKNMSKTLQSFVPDAKIELIWQPLAILDIPPPKADVKLVEDGYQSTVARTGHGLQRAFIMTMLQHLSAAQISKENKDSQSESIGKLPDLILVIEEPELYQHPNRQRHLAKILFSLAEGTIPGVSERIQIIYSTHSPHFVGIDRIGQIRLLRKVTNAGKPKITKIFSTNLDEVAEKIWTAYNKSTPKPTAKTLLARLNTIMTPWMNEGFFADVVVLVEGETDRAALLRAAKEKNYELESMGFSIIPCNGKANFDRPYTIFSELRIPIYLIWDGDKGNTGADPRDNNNLLRLLKKTPVDWPSSIEDTYACFESNLESTMINEIGQTIFNQNLSACKKDLNIPSRDKAIKNCAVIATVIQEAYKQNKTCVSLEKITQKILALKN